MKNVIWILLIPLLLFACKDDDNEPEEIEYITIVGHTYVAERYTYSFTDERTIHLFLIYTFNKDGTIAIEERDGSETGKLRESKKGYFEYEHPVLRLKVQGICEDCFNNFTATVNNDKKEFSYEIFISYNEKETLKFKAKNT